MKLVAGSLLPSPAVRLPANGFTLLEALFVVASMGILTAAAIPGLLAGLDGARAVAAARHLAQQCATARWLAAARGRHVALRFTPATDDYAQQLFVDGNRNGVLAAEIATGVDLPLDEPATLSSLFRGARIAIDPSLGLGTDPIRLSGSALLSFSPTGTASAGTVYVLGRDGTQLAVRVLGATGRTRVLRYHRLSGSWETP